jgi:CubicO group peptidase (beta-lactamase class C family)
MKKLFLLFSFLFIVADISAQPKNNPDQLYNTIDSIATGTIRVSDIPGFVLGVIVNNRIVFEKAYGVQSVQTHQPLTIHSDFHMASVSKPFAATAIMQLVEEGKLCLDSPLIKYLPYFKMKDERYKLITLNEILTHSSGIPDVTDYEWDKPQTDDSAAERYVKSFAGMDLDFAPGTQFNYSNAAFDILAEVIAKTSGMTFEKYIEKNIFAAAGMTESSFLLSDIPVSRRTSPHVIGDSLVESVSAIYPYNRIHAPSSTLHSNINDMLKWASLWLNKGAIDGHAIIDTSTWSNMLTTRRQATPDYKVCLSWFTVAVGDKIIYFHNGSDLGYRSFVGFDPADKVAVVLMGNNDLFNTLDPAVAIFKSILLHSPAKDSLTPIFLELRKYILKGGIEKVKAVYYEEMKQHPDEYGFGAGNVVTLADWLYDRGYKQQSIDVLIFCTELDPKNALWYEYTGDVYSAWDKKEDALIWYRKALVIDPSKDEIKQKIDSLGKKLY